MNGAPDRINEVRHCASQRRYSIQGDREVRHETKDGSQVDRKVRHQLLRAREEEQSYCEINGSGAGRALEQMVSRGSIHVQVNRGCAGRYVDALATA